MTPLDGTLTFLGDVACPNELVASAAAIERLPFGATVINLEGALCPPDKLGSVPRRALYNSTRLLPTLAQWNVRAATLANNHISDLGRLPSETNRRLDEVGIGAFGAGDNLAEASRPFGLTVGGAEVQLLGFNWEVIPWRSAGRNRAGANPLQPPAVFDSLRRILSERREAQVVIVMHWNIELERFPQPAQRLMAFDLIDAGAAAVIGHHPHCPQGIEWHAGRPIVYSLGDWFLPQGDYFGLRINLPEYTIGQLAFEWDPQGISSKCHWFEYDRQSHNVRLVASDDAKSSSRARKLTPFAGLSHPEYVRWFSKHRVKSRGLPIYRDYRHALRNRFRDWYSIGRGWIVRRAAAWNLRE